MGAPSGPPAAGHTHDLVEGPLVGDLLWAHLRDTRKVDQGFGNTLWVWISGKK